MNNRCKFVRDVIFLPSKETFLLEMMKKGKKKTWLLIPHGFIVFNINFVKPLVADWEKHVCDCTGINWHKRLTV